MATEPSLSTLKAVPTDQPSSERIQGAPVRHRRSGRIARRLEVTVRWQERGQWRDDPAATTMLSRYGCMLSAQCRIKLGEEIRLYWTEKQRETRAKVVFRSLEANEVRLAVEFLDTDDFWGIDFPPSFMSITT